MSNGTSFNGTTTASQRGGRLLGQGVYGCTFSPAPRCAGGKVFKEVGGLPAVGKVTIDDPEEEIGIGRAIMRLPAATAYFALPSETCEPAMPVQDPDVAACKVIKEAPIGSSFSLLAMPAGGEAFSRWVAADKARTAAHFKRIFIHLLEGMIIYQKAGYVHNDIHDANVLVDAKGVARYIDFGLAFHLPDVKTWDDANLGRTFKPKYFWQAPEVHLARMFMSGVSIQRGIQQLKEISPEYTRMEMQFPGRPTMEASFTALATRSRSFLARDWDAFVRAYAPAFDWWRVGLLMWDTWDNLLAWSGLRETELWAERELIRKVLAGMTTFSPQQRMSPATALRLLDPTNKLA
jgi:hypothetical protein